MQALTFTIQIRAKPKLVWAVLWDDRTFRRWAGLIDPGTYMVGSLREGGTVQFVSAENGYGVTSYVETLIPEQYVRLRHRGDTKQFGAQDRADEWTGGVESYELKAVADGTHVTICADVPEAMVEYFQSMYPRVMEAIRDMSERPAIQDGSRSSRSV